MAFIDTYTAGTVSLTNGSAVVTGSSTNWISSGLGNVSKGHIFARGTFTAIIKSVDSATQITLYEPFPGTTVSGASYEVLRTSRVETPEVVGYLQQLLTKGQAANPFTRVDLDSGSVRASFRDDGTGQLGWYVGTTGAADGSQVKAATVNKSSGAVSFGSTLGVGVATPVNGPGLGAHIHGPGGLHLSNSTTGNEAFDGSLIYPNGVDLDFYNYETTGQIKFFTNTVERLRISAGGSVGIGTTSPAYKLDIQDSAVPLRVLSSGQDAVARFECTGAGGRIYHVGSTGSSSGAGNGFGIYDVTASSLRMIVTPSGGIVARTGETQEILRLVRGSNTTKKTYIAFGNDAASTWQLGADINDDGGQNFFLYDAVIGAIRWLVDTSGNFTPGGDIAAALGSGAFRWSVLYAGTGTINTSDAREKTAIRPLNPAELRAAQRLAMEIGVYQWLEAVKEKGDAARQHVGMTVQRAVEIMEEEGLDPWAYGFMCRDEITRKVKVTQKRVVAKIEEVEVSYVEIEVRDGVPVQVTKTRTDKRPVMQSVAVLDEAGKPVLQEVQATEEVTEIYTEIEMRDGKPVQVEKKRTVKVPVFDTVQVVTAKGKPVTAEVEVQVGLDDEGKPVMAREKRPVTTQVPVMTTEPVMHSVPVMVEEEVEVEIDEPAGDRLGFRPDQIDRFIMRGLAEKIALLEAK